MGATHHGRGLLLCDRSRQSHASPRQPGSLDRSRTSPGPPPTQGTALFLPSLPSARRLDLARLACVANQIPLTRAPSRARRGDWASSPAHGLGPSHELVTGLLEVGAVQGSLDPPRHHRASSVDGGSRSAGARRRACRDVLGLSGSASLGRRGALLARTLENTAGGETVCAA